MNNRPNNYIYTKIYVCSFNVCSVISSLVSQSRTLLLRMQYNGGGMGDVRNCRQQFYNWNLGCVLSHIAQLFVPLFCLFHDLKLFP